MPWLSDAAVHGVRLNREVHLVMSRAHPRVMHIDDDPTMLRFSRIVLRAAGIEVTTTDDPQELLAAVDARYDLFLVDLLLPGADGIALCRQLRNAGWDGPILVLSNKTLSGAERKRLKELGARHTMKLLGPQGLVRSVQRCLARPSDNGWARLQAQP